MSTSPEARPFQAFYPVVCGVSQSASSLSVWMPYALPCHPFRLLFSQTPSFTCLHWSGVCWTLKESPLQISGVLFLCLFLSRRTLPCPCSLCLPGFSALCLQLGRFTGCYLGFPSLPHGLGALSRQTLGKSLTFHLVFITWCPLSSKALFHVFCQRFQLSCLEGESNFLLLHLGWKWECSITEF